MKIAVNEDSRKVSTFLRTLSAGAVASFITQPFEVLKTRMIISSSNYVSDNHRSIVSRGWKQYMRGASIAVIRQAFGFSIYTSLIQNFNRRIEARSESINKYVKYSLSAISAKYMAMTFESPLTIIKTRLEANPNSTVPQEFKTILENPLKEVKRGLGSTFAREGFYSLFHYNTYRFLKDDLLKAQFDLESNFFPAFLAGIVAITVSQPFEVLRSKITLSKSNATYMDVYRQILRVRGWKGFFVGYLPRLLRKPINSGISWTIIENIKQ